MYFSAAVQFLTSQINKVPFTNIFDSYMKTTGMTIGEFDLSEYWHGLDDPFDFVNDFVVLALMVVLVMAYVSFLVALAVGDIGKQLNEAAMDTTILQVNFY